MTAAGESALEGLSLEPATDGWDAKRIEREKEVVGQFPDVSYINEGIRRINAQEVAARNLGNTGDSVPSMFRMHESLPNMFLLCHL